MDKKIHTVVIFIGSGVLSLILILIPMLTSVSYIYNWNNTIKFFLVAATLCELVVLMLIIAFKSEE